MKYSVRSLTLAGWLLVGATLVVVLACGLPYGAWLRGVLPGQPRFIMTKLTFLVGLAPLVAVAVVVFWVGARLLNSLGLPVVRNPKQS